MTGIREYIVKGQKTREVIPIFVPHTKNFARVMVFNDHYNGPSSDVISFDTPEGSEYYMWSSTMISSTVCWCRTPRYAIPIYNYTTLIILI